MIEDRPDPLTAVGCSLLNAIAHDARTPANNLFKRLTISDLRQTQSAMDRSGEAARAARWMIVLVMLGVWIYLLLVPAQSLPIGTVNGTFANSCCAEISLQNGHGSSRDVEFDYVVQRGKNGPLIVLDHQNLVVGPKALGVASSKGEFLRVAPQPKPTWIEIDGRRFVRR